MRRKITPQPRPLCCLLLLALLGACGGETTTQHSPATPADTTPVLYTIEGIVQLENPRDDQRGIQVFCAGSSHFAFTDDQGFYRIEQLPPGTYEIAAQRHGYQTATLGEITLEPDPAPEQRLFSLAAAVLQSNAQTDPAPPPADSGELSGRVILAGPGGPGPVRLSLEGTDLQATSKPSGEFRIEGIPPGQYILVASHPGFEDSLLETSILPDEITRLPDTLYLYPEGSAPADPLVYGQILFLDRRGELLPSAPPAQVGIVENGQTATTNDEGRFYFDELPPGTYTLIATAEGFTLREQVRAVVGQEPALPVLVMEQAGGPPDTQATLTGRLILQGAAPGQTPQGARLALVGTSHMATADAQGRFRIEGIQPGIHTLLAELSGFLPLTIEGITLEQDDEFDLGELTLQPDHETPRVIAALPEERRSWTIRPEMRISLFFNQPMRLESLNQNLSLDPPHPFEIQRAQPDPETDARDRIDLILRNRAGQSLAYDSSYRLTLARGALDTQGFATEQDYRYQFETGGLRLLATEPPNEAEGLDLSGNETLRFFFNGVLDPEHLDARSVELSPAPLSSGFPRLFQDPRNGWSVLALPVTLEWDTRYRLRLDRGLRSIEGTRMDERPRLEFRTAKRAEHPGTFKEPPAYRGF